MHALIANWLRYRDDASLEVAVRALSGRWRPWTADGGRAEVVDAAQRFIAHAGPSRSAAQWTVLQALLDHLNLHPVDCEFVVGAIEAAVAPWDSPEFGTRLREWMDSLEATMPSTRDRREQGLSMLAIWASTHIGFDEESVSESAVELQGDLPDERDSPPPALLVCDAYSRFLLRRRLIGVDRITLSPYELDSAIAASCGGIPTDAVAQCIAPWLLSLWLMDWAETGREIVEAYGRTVEPLPSLLPSGHPAATRHLGLDTGVHYALHHGPLLGWWLNFALGDSDDERIPSVFDSCVTLLERARAKENDDSKADDGFLWGMSYFALAAASSYSTRYPVDPTLRHKMVVVADLVAERLTTNPHAILRILRDPRLQPPEGADNPAASADAKLGSELQDDATPTAPLSSDPWPFPDSCKEVSEYSCALAEATQRVPRTPIRHCHAHSVVRCEDQSWLSWLPASTLLLGLYDIPLPEDDLATLCVVAVHSPTKGVLRECFAARLGGKRTGFLTENVKRARDTAWDQFEETHDIASLVSDLLVVRRKERQEVSRVDSLVDRCIAWAADQIGRVTDLHEYDCMFAARGELAGVCPALLGSDRPLIDRVRSITCVPSGTHAVGMWTKAMSTRAIASSSSIAVIGHEREGSDSHPLAGQGTRHMFQRIVQARSGPKSAWFAARLLTAGQQPLATCARARRASSQSHVAIVAGHGGTTREQMGVQLADGLYPSQQDAGSPIEIYASCFGLQWGQRGIFADLFSPVVDEFTLSRLLSSSTRTTIAAGFAEKVSFGAAGEIAVDLAESVLVSVPSPFEAARRAAALLRDQLIRCGFAPGSMLDGAASVPPWEALRLDTLLSLRVAGFCPCTSAI